MKASMAAGIIAAALIGAALLTAIDAPADVRAAPGAPPNADAEHDTLAGCPAAVPFTESVERLKAIRVYKAANGESAFETVEFKGESKAYFKPGEMFSHNLLANAGKIQVISGPANAVLPYHAPLGKEIFLTIQGSSTVVLPNGQERPVLPGTIVIFDDGGSKTGHAGRTGPCGYVAISVAFPDSANNP